MARLVALYRANPAEFHQVLRYLLVGGWNTVFGIGSYAALYLLLYGRVHYLLLVVPSDLLAITNAYICYKIFVFRTKGNVLREYIRTCLVYGASALFGLAGMWILVSLLGLPPILAKALLTIATVIISYFGHKHVSFRAKPAGPNAPGAAEPESPPSDSA